LVDNPPTVNTIQAGQAILDKWQLFDAATGQPISDPMSHHLPDGHAHTEGRHHAQGGVPVQEVAAAR